MPRSLVRVAIWGPLLILAALAIAYIAMHRPFAVDPAELSTVPLDPDDPDRTRIGALEYRGGLDIPRMGQNIGGLSALRWDDETNKLVALTDDARAVWLVVDLGPLLTDLTFSGVTDLKGPNGEPLTGKEQGDSESLTRSPTGGWLVGFERDHRVLRYAEFEGLPEPTEFDPVALLGTMEDNGGLEAMASAPDLWIGCAERAATPQRANCVRLQGEQSPQPFAARPPAALAELGAVPTDADIGEDGTLYVLFRSYSPTEGNSAAIVAYDSDGTRRELLTLRPPLTVDNFEGLAVQERDGRTFLFIVSDDNFSSSQRTLLMKFEIVGEGD